MGLGRSPVNPALPWLATAGLAFLAFLRFLSTGEVDTVVVVLGVGAVVAPLVPWKDLQSLKVGPVELAMRAEVERALEGFAVPEPERAGGVPRRGDRLPEEIGREVERVWPILPQIRGRRVLWADDDAPLVLAERRLFRSLGLEVVPVASTAEAEAALARDTDFDLFISDIGRSLEDPVPLDGGEVEASIQFVRDLRTRTGDRRTQHLPVIFYTANETRHLDALAAPVRSPGFSTDACNQPLDLLRLAVQRLLWPPQGSEVVLTDKRTAFTEAHGPGRLPASVVPLEP